MPTAKRLLNIGMQNNQQYGKMYTSK